MMYLNCETAAPFDFCSCGKYISEAGAVHPRRCLDTFVLLFGCGGKFDICQGDNEYSLVPNSYMLLFPGKEHYGARPSEGTVAEYWCHFKINGAWKTSDYNETVKMIHSEESVGRAADSFYRIPEFGMTEDSERLTLMFNQLIDISQSSPIYRKRMCDYTLSLMLSYISREFINSVLLNDSNDTTARVSQIKEWIRINSRSDLKVSEIAEHFSYNPNYLSSMFRRATGYTVVDYIRKARINEAEKLLLNTNLTIKEIALECGFYDSKHFLKVFKKFKNVTPTSYRNACFNVHYNNK